MPPVVRLDETLAHRPAARHKEKMAEIVNRKHVRKDKARRDRESEADANRRRFSRTKAEKTADKDAETRARQSLAGKQLEPEKP